MYVFEFNSIHQSNITTAAASTMGFGQQAHPRIQRTVGPQGADGADGIDGAAVVPDTACVAAPFLKPYGFSLSTFI